MLQHAQLHLHDSLHSVHTHSYYLRGRNQELHSIPILTTQTTTSPHTTKDTSYVNISIKPITTYLCSEFQQFNSLQRIQKILVKLISGAKKYELLWINKLHTYTPIGLNIVTHLKSTNIPLILKYSNSASQLLRQVKKHFTSLFTKICKTF